MRKLVLICMYLFAITFRSSCLPIRFGLFLCSYILVYLSAYTFWSFCPSTRFGTFVCSYVFVYLLCLYVMVVCHTFCSICPDVWLNSSYAMAYLSIRFCLSVHTFWSICPYVWSSYLSICFDPFVSIRFSLCMFIRLVCSSVSTSDRARFRAR